ncbi:uncharacterized protein PAC_05189 [Phialocephala subalpina]|uniref:Aminoglycoside phosphotransferase domain-containing protein n=1 Tax=Phialocephala subalpina TaxID=576137 RepID=A0A1L7WRA5_9HELO|nr:uncharacterized protein PAC_05189 [Phialocephala subalpina]
MGTPIDHLPLPLTNESIIALIESISLPKPLSSSSAKVTAEYHSIYMLSLPTGDHKNLVLKVSGPHIPKIKTENEAAIMSCVSQNTTIPIPNVIAYDSSTSNPLNHEYIILSRSPGETLGDIYHTLCKEKSRQHPRANPYNPPSTSCPLLDFYQRPNVQRKQIPDIEKYFPGENFSTLNIWGPFPTLEAFIIALEENAEELDKVKLKPTHKDLHSANILYSRSSGKITAILDWVFSGIVPFTRWNPTNAFLAVPPFHDAEMLVEKRRLQERLVQEEV